jgi:hypothetical protein
VMYPEYAKVEKAYVAGKKFRRNMIISVDEAKKLIGVDVYCTYMRFKEDIAVYVTQHRTTSGYDGDMYSDFFVLDIDDKDLKKAKDRAIALISRLRKDFGVAVEEVRFYFSGSKGFHIEIPSEMFGYEPGRGLADVFKRIAGVLMGGLVFDTSIYQFNRQWRVPNTKNSKGDRYKVPLTPNEVIDLSIDEIRTLAEKPRLDFEYPTCSGLNNKLRQLYADALKPPKTPLADTESGQQGNRVSGVVEEGGRDNYLAAEAGRLIKAGYQDEQILSMLSGLNQNFCVPPLGESDILRIVKSIRKKDTLTKAQQDFEADVPIHTMEHLMKKDLPPIEYVIPDFLARRGVFALAGAGKMGKSWLAFDMALHVASGLRFLGRDTKKTKTLYIDLETCEHSMKDRMHKLMDGGKFDLKNLCYTHTFPRIGRGFTEALIKAADEGFKFFIVDVFVKIRGRDHAKNAKEYDRDYDDVGAIKEIATERDLCVMFITHTRKFVDPDDPFNDIVGSSGVVAAADGSAVLRRKRNEQTGNLYITSRVFKEQALTLQFDLNNCRWSYVGTSSEVKEIQEQEDWNKNILVVTIRRLLQTEAKWVGSPSNLYDEIFKTSENQLIYDFDASTIPSSAVAVGLAVRKMAERLREEGIHVSSSRGRSAANIVIQR